MDGLAEADVGLFVVDARSGITPADLDIAERAAPAAQADPGAGQQVRGPAGRGQASEAWSLGLGEPLPVSGEHGDGIPDLLTALRPYSSREAPAPVADAAAEDAPPDATEDERPDRPLRLAIIGRPNAGKSSLINRLIDEERMLTGPEPGLTRDSVSLRFTWHGRVIELVDTAGLRRGPGSRPSWRSFRPRPPCARSSSPMSWRWWWTPPRRSSARI